MTRPIKFRAWDMQHENIVSWEQALRNFQMDEFFTPMDDFVLMQYTGLTDRNGVEIYEGDVVELRKADGEKFGWGKVRFENCCFAVWDDYESLRDLSAGHDGSVEVIGNIYQNPELLKEDE